jgi:hypothetical protein
MKTLILLALLAAQPVTEPTDEQCHAAYGTAIHHPGIEKIPDLLRQCIEKDTPKTS